MLGQVGEDERVRAGRRETAEEEEKGMGGGRTPAPGEELAARGSRFFCD
jgi:hypothetical protein